MSDDKNEKKDEEIVTNSESTEEVKEVVEESKVEVSEEPVIEAKAEEEPAPNTPEEKNEPIAEATVEPTPEPEPTTVASNVEEPKVEIPDQVVNSNNNNNYSNYQQNTSNTTNQAQPQTEKTPSEKKGMAIFALILSILGFFTSIFVIGGLFGFIAIILSIVVLAKKKRRKRYGNNSINTFSIINVWSMYKCISNTSIIRNNGFRNFNIQSVF